VEATDSAKARIKAKILGVLQAPSLSGMLDTVHTIDDFVVTSASTAGIKIEQCSILRSIMVQNAFPILFVGDAHAIDEYFRYVHSTLKQCHAVQPPALAALLRPPFHERPAFARHRLKVDPLKLHECAQLYRLALFRFESEETVSNDGRQVLRELIATLKISFDDLGKMFKVSGETVRRWENGTSSLPVDKTATILSTRAPLDKLLQIFQPERLPVVIRRDADLFDGERALDWILRGRIADVASRYEVTLRYQA
jgi:hypothetical protein